MLSVRAVYVLSSLQPFEKVETLAVEGRRSNMIFIENSRTDALN